jgi:hypothetical protein
MPAQAHAPTATTASVTAYASAIDDSPATRVASQGAKPRPTITVDLGASPKLARRALDVIAAETADAVTPGSSELVI